MCTVVAVDMTFWHDQNNNNEFNKVPLNYRLKYETMTVTK